MPCDLAGGAWRGGGAGETRDTAHASFDPRARVEEKRATPPRPVAAEPWKAKKAYDGNAAPDEEQQLEKAAVRIEAIWRGHQVRRSSRRVAFLQHEEEEEEERKAATMIQAM